MPSIPAIENLSSATKYVIAFAIIFVLLALFALVLRRLTGGRGTLSSERGRGRQPRLGIVDVYDLDRQRQLILLRRDNVEHLLLVGGPNDVVVETNIVRVAGARLPPAQPDPVERSDSVEIAPVRPTIEPALPRAENPVTAHLGHLETAIANAALEQIVAPARAAEPLRPSEVKAKAEPVSPPRSNPPAPEVRPATRPLTTPVGRANLAAPDPAPPPAVSPPPASPPPPAALGNMSRQLEETLRREPAAPRPAPSVEPRRAPEPPRPAPTPVAAAPVAPTPVAATPIAAPPAPKPPEPRPPAAPQPAPAPAAPVKAAAPSPPPPGPAPVQAPPPPAPKPAPEPPPAPAEPPSRDPFSIEDIEAEFARLLGRPLEKK